MLSMRKENGCWQRLADGRSGRHCLAAADRDDAQSKCTKKFLSEYYCYMCMCYHPFSRRYEGDYWYGREEREPR